MPDKAATICDICQDCAMNLCSIIEWMVIPTRVSHLKLLLDASLYTCINTKLESAHVFLCTLWSLELIRNELGRSKSEPIYQDKTLNYDKGQYTLSDHGNRLTGKVWMISCHTTFFWCRRNIASFLVRDPVFEGMSKARGQEKAWSLVLFLMLNGFLIFPARNTWLGASNQLVVWLNLDIWSCDLLPWRNNLWRQINCNDDHDCLLIKYISILIMSAPRMLFYVRWIAYWLSPNFHE